MMRLTELNPQWLFRDGKRVGIIFRCPLPSRQAYRQTCFFVGMKVGEQRAIVRSTLGLDDLYDVQLCKDDIAWTVHVPPAPTEPANILDPEQASLETLTIMPSIDGSIGGNWHGFITNGEVK